MKTLLFYSNEILSRNFFGISVIRKYLIFVHAYKKIYIKKIEIFQSHAADIIDILITKILYR